LCSVLVTPLGCQQPGRELPTTRAPNQSTSEGRKGHGKGAQTLGWARNAPSCNAIWRKMVAIQLSIRGQTEDAFSRHLSRNIGCRGP